MVRLSPYGWFEIHTQDKPRLWKSPPESMETVVEVFNEDRLAQTQIPHMFSIPCLMTHLWRRKLSKDAGVLFAINVGPYFCPSSMHEPLIVLNFFPGSCFKLQRSMGATGGFSSP